MQKTLATRKENYKSQPYKRLTKEWFLWRYPDDGIQRWESFVSKSKQSLENFVNRYGQEEGKRKYQETMSKKNTVALKRAKSGDGAIKEWYQKASQSNKEKIKAMSDDEYNNWMSNKVDKANKTKKERYGNKSKFDLYLERYGEQGPQLYAEYLQKIFKSIGASQVAESIFKSIINDNPWLKNYTLYYRDSEDVTKKEWFIADKTGVSFYDFCVKEAKVILEYDGKQWHPTKDQVEQYGDTLMEVTGISYKTKFILDEAKRTKAMRHGFSVYTIRSDFTDAQQCSIIEQFINEVKKNGRK